MLLIQHDCYIDLKSSKHYAVWKKYESGYYNDLIIVSSWPLREKRSE